MFWALMWWGLLGFVFVLAHYAYITHKYAPLAPKEAKLTPVDVWLTLGLFAISGPFVYVLMILALIKYLAKK